MAHSRFVNAFSRITKNYVFRIKILCHTDLVCGVTVFLFSLRWWEKAECVCVCVCVSGGGGSGTFSSYNVLIQK